MYKKRHLEQEILFMAQHFKVVLVTGARQVGKTTLLKNVLPDLPLFTFDMHTDHHRIRQNPELFLRSKPRPIILDEVQYVPELLSSIKRLVDESDQPGQYFLTGSHNLSMLRGVTESMAGRVGIIDLEQMTIFEQADMPQASWLESYLEKPDSLIHRVSGLAEPYQPIEAIWRGGFPGFVGRDAKLFDRYFSAYVRTYVERDARYDTEFDNVQDFERFLGIAAATTGKEINEAHFCRELGIARKTVERWRYILRRTYQWREVPAYVNNPIKRVIKKNKGYMTDTGLACYLQRIWDDQVLFVHPGLGEMFETYCANLVFRLSSALSRRPMIYHWRTRAGAEVDLLLEAKGKLYPIEIKVGTNLSKYDARGIHALRDTYGDDVVQHGLILYPGREAYLLTENVTALPFNAVVNGA